MRSWRNVLGLGPADTHQTARAKYLQLARKLHPNKGGTTQAFQELQKAWENATLHYTSRTNTRTSSSSPRGKPASPRGKPASPRTRQKPDARAPIHTLADIYNALDQDTYATAYNALPNVNRSELKAAFSKWATRSKLSPAAQKKLSSAIRVVSKEDVARRIKMIGAGIKSKIGKRPFALLVELGTLAENTFRPDSAIVLASLVVRLTGRLPRVIPVIDGRVDNERVHLALKSGIRDFVLIDDAMITGRQKARLATNLGQVISEYARNPRLPRIGREKQDEVVRTALWIGVAYLTEQALDRVASATKYVSEFLNDYRVFVMADVSKPPRVSRRVRLETWWRLPKKNRLADSALMLFPHSKPDRNFFGASLASYLGESVPNAWPALNRSLPK